MELLEKDNIGSEEIKKWYDEEGRPHYEGEECYETRYDAISTGRACAKSQFVRNYSEERKEEWELDDEGESWLYYRGEDYDEIRNEDYCLTENDWQQDQEPTYMGVPIQPRDPEDDPVYRAWRDGMDTRWAEVIGETIFITGVPIEVESQNLWEDENVFELITEFCDSCNKLFTQIMTLPICPVCHMFICECGKCDCRSS